MPFKPIYIFRIIVCICCLFTAYLNSYAQNEEIYLTQTAYFKANPVYDIVKDNKSGAILFGSDKGLIRYNSSEFEQIPSNSKISNAISRIFQHNGNIYCITFSGEILQYHNDSLLVINQLFKINNKLIEDIKAIEFLDQNIYIVTSNKLYIFNLKTYQSNFSFEDSDFAYVLNDGIVQFRNQIYISALSKLYTYKQNNLSVIETKKEPKKIFKFQNSISLIPNNFNHSGIVNSLFSNKFIQQKLPAILIQTKINQIKEVENEWWVCTHDGLFILDKYSLRLKNHYLKENNVSNILINEDDAIWISTTDNGVYFGPNRHILQQNLNEILGDISIIKIAANNILIGSTKGELLVKENNKKNSSLFQFKVKTPVKFIEISPNNQWIWTSHGVADLQSKKIIYDEYLGNTIASYIENSFLIGSSFLAYQIRKDAKAFSENSNETISFGKYKLPIKILTEGRIKKLFYDSSIGLFISTPGKFLFVDGNKNLNYVNIPSDINAIAKKNNHEVYLSAFNNGLYQFNIKKNKISPIYDLQNFTSIEKIKINNNVVYFLSSNQLFQYHKGQLINLNNKIGTSSLKINDFELKNNQILLAENNRIISFSLDQFNKNYHSQFNIRSIFSDSKKFDITSPIIEIEDNNLSIQYEVIAYNNQNQYSIQYKFTENDGNELITENLSGKIHLLSIPYGKNTIELNLMRDNKIIDSKKINIDHPKPFYITWWFIVFCILILGIFFLTLLKFYLKKLKKKEELKLNYIQSRLTALKLQMNPHFLYNVLTSIQGLMYAGKKAEASAYLVKFSDLMRQVLNTSTQENTELKNELALIENYLELEKSRFNQDFFYSLDINNQLDIDQILIPGMVLQPFVENAIKHGLMNKQGDKKLAISVFIKNTDLIILIDDNGIGRKKSEELNKINGKKYKSIAMDSIRARIDLINKINKNKISIDIEDKYEQQIPTGTSIKLTFNKWINEQY